MTWPATSRQARGYGKDWDRLRLVILRRDRYLCMCDRCRGGAPGGRITLAREVDHIKPKAQGGTDDPSNLRAINKDCHKRVTAEQQGKVLRPKGCDINGIPTDPLHPWNRGRG